MQVKALLILLRPSGHKGSKTARRATTQENKPARPARAGSGVRQTRDVAAAPAVDAGISKQAYSRRSGIPVALVVALAPCLALGVSRGARAQSAVVPAASAASTVDVAASTNDTGGAGQASGDGAQYQVSAVHPRRLELGNTFDGSTGLLRMLSADSGDTGTFRISIIQSYFKANGFLCHSCALPGGRPSSEPDDLSQTGTRVGLSATPLEFLEAYAALRYQSTSDSRGDPHAIQLVGDLTLGAKAFTAPSADRIYSFGGAIDGRMLGTPDSVGIDGASVALRALGTLDLTRRTRAEDRVPLRVHANLGYLIDGSGALAKDTERERRAVIGDNRISRIERFSHDINRLDTVRPALGVEGVFPYVRPFGEWSVDIPVNRQGFSCADVAIRSAGDECLSRAGFSGIASRLTLGIRAYPWVRQWLEGLALLAAIDVGTGATSSFVEEIAPERPWAVHIGLGWAVDTTPRDQRRPKIVTVEKVIHHPAPPSAPDRHIEGTVVRAGGSERVPGAVVHFAGHDLSGLVTDENGRFRSGGLEPGSYRLTVTADGFKDGECTAEVPESADMGTSGATAPAASTVPAASQRPVVVTVVCTIEALPRTATITGAIRDSDTTMFVEGATVTITDPLGRSLSLRTDAQGAFRFANVPAGKSRLSVQADHYLRGGADIDLGARQDVTTQIFLHPRPKTPNVVITNTELKVKKDVQFLHDSAELLPESAAVLEEAAEILRDHPEITHLEVQGHTDASGPPEHNLQLSEARANAVRNALIAFGVDAGRLTARGYGQEMPLAPNTSARNRAKNRRVQLVILKQSAPVPP